MTIDNEVGAQQFLNIALKSIEMVQDLTNDDEVKRSIIFLTDKFVQSKPSTGDMKSTEGGEVQGRYSDISSKIPSIKAP